MWFGMLAAMASRAKLLGLLMQYRTEVIHHEGLGRQSRMCWMWLKHVGKIDSLHMHVHSFQEAGKQTPLWSHSPCSQNLLSVSDDSALWLSFYLT